MQLFDDEEEGLKASHELIAMKDEPEKLAAMVRDVVGEYGVEAVIGGAMIGIAKLLVAAHDAQQRLNRLEELEQNRRVKP